jgi:alpha-glucuronidase
MGTNRVKQVNVCFFRSLFKQNQTTVTIAQKRLNKVKQVLDGKLMKRKLFTILLIGLLAFSCLNLAGAKVVKCPTCNGVGTIPCPSCNGTGVIT